MLMRWIFFGVALMAAAYGLVFVSTYYAAHREIQSDFRAMQDETLGQVLRGNIESEIAEASKNVLELPQVASSM